MATALLATMVPVGMSVSAAEVPVKHASAVQAAALSTAILEYTLELADEDIATGELDGVHHIVVAEFWRRYNYGKEVLANAKSANPTVMQDNIDQAWKDIIEIMQYFSFNEDDPDLQIDF